jgi:hypothetical protein
MIPVALIRASRRRNARPAFQIVRFSESRLAGVRGPAVQPVLKSRGRNRLQCIRR